jgi:hypothetical protein
MTSPGNTTAPKPNAPTLDSRTSNLRTAIIAAFVTACVFFLFSASSVALQHDRQQGRPSAPMWVFLLGTGFFLAPCIISWFLLSRREQKSIASRGWRRLRFLRRVCAGFTVRLHGNVLLCGNVCLEWSARWRIDGSGIDHACVHGNQSLDRVVGIQNRKDSVECVWHGAGRNRLLSLFWFSVAQP